MLEDKKTNSQIMGTLQAGNPIKGTKLKHIVQQIIRFRIKLWSEFLYSQGEVNGYES